MHLNRLRVILCQLVRELQKPAHEDGIEVPLLKWREHTCRIAGSACLIA
jgi:hypothetical protein